MTISPDGIVIKPLPVVPDDGWATIEYACDPETGESRVVRDWMDDPAYAAAVNAGKRVYGTTATELT